MLQIFLRYHTNLAKKKKNLIVNPKRHQLPSYSYSLSFFFFLQGIPTLFEYYLSQYLVLSYHCVQFCNSGNKRSITQEQEKTRARDVCTYVTGDMRRALVLAGGHVDGHDLVLGTDLLQAHQDAHHVRRHRRPVHLRRRHFSLSLINQLSSRGVDGD